MGRRCAHSVAMGVGCRCRACGVPPPWMALYGRMAGVHHARFPPAPRRAAGGFARSRRRYRPSQRKRSKSGSDPFGCVSNQPGGAQSTPNRTATTTKPIRNPVISHTAGFLPQSFPRHTRPQQTQCCSARRFGRQQCRLGCSCKRPVRLQNRTAAWAEPAVRPNTPDCQSSSLGRMPKGASCTGRPKVLLPSRPFGRSCRCRFQRTCWHTCSIRVAPRRREASYPHYSPASALMFLN